MIDKIVVVIDVSKTSEIALHLACDLAENTVQSCTLFTHLSLKLSPLRTVTRMSTTPNKQKEKSLTDRPN